MNIQLPPVALFDFDGTITTKDSMIACVLFDISSPKVIARLFASLLPVSLSLLISKNQLAKEIL